MSDMDHIRELLRGWGAYGPRGSGYAWQALPVDEMTDAELLMAAEQIAAGDKTT